MAGRGAGYQVVSRQTGEVLRHFDRRQDARNYVRGHPGTRSTEYGHRIAAFQRTHPGASRAAARGHAPRAERPPRPRGVQRQQIGQRIAATNDPTREHIRSAFRRTRSRRVRFIAHAMTEYGSNGRGGPELRWQSQNFTRRDLEAYLDANPDPHDLISAIFGNHTGGEIRRIEIEEIP